MSKSGEWRKANPERAEQIRRRSLEKRRSPCRMCGAKMPWPSPGAKFCSDECRGAARKQVNKAAYERARSEFYAWKLSLGACQRCGWVGHPAALDFHHPDPSVKEERFTVKSWRKFKTEMEGCELICANCHRIEHAGDAA